MLALVLAVVYVLRLMALVLLTAAAPLALAAYALPQTAWAARWWWRALTACLAIQVAQALVLTAAVRVFSSAGWIPLNGTRGGSVLPVLTAICLLYIMMRIPWWISRPVLSPFGPSPIRRTVKFAFYAAVLSRVSPLLRGAAGARRPPSAAGGRGRGPAGPRGGGPRGGPARARSTARRQARNRPRHQHRAWPGTARRHRPGPGPARGHRTWPRSARRHRAAAARQRPGTPPRPGPARGTIAGTGREPAAPAPGARPGSRQARPGPAAASPAARGPAGPRQPGRPRRCRAGRRARRGPASPSCCPPG